MILESQIEQHFKKKVEAHGALVWKFTSPGRAGVPDRIVILPGGRVVFAEMKAPGKKLRPLQRAVISLIRKTGCHVWVIDSLEKVDEFIEKEVTPNEVYTASISGGVNPKTRKS